MFSDRINNVVFEDRVLICLGTWSEGAAKCFRKICWAGMSGCVVALIVATVANCIICK